jgi:Initiation factor 2 subunit family
VACHRRLGYRDGTDLSLTRSGLACPCLGRRDPSTQSGGFADRLGACPYGVPHTVIPDNTGGHLMQHGMVDLVIVGTDRVTANGDVCNKMRTHLKALAAHDNAVPFYVALPSPTIDFSIRDGRQIPIEQRSADEVATMTGRTADGRIETIRVVSEGSAVANYGFDVTPARLVTGLITERGVVKPDRGANFPGMTARRFHFVSRRYVPSTDGLSSRIAGPMACAREFATGTR